MSKRSNIFESLKDYIPAEGKDKIIESRSQHIISSVIHLMEAIDSHYSEEDADYLKRRLLTSMKNGDATRFTRSMDKIRKNTK